MKEERDEEVLAKALELKIKSTKLISVIPIMVDSGQMYSQLIFVFEDGVRITLGTDEDNCGLYLADYVHATHEA